MPCNNQRLLYNNHRRTTNIEIGSTKLEEGRTSLEIATGEFTKTPTESVASPALEAPVNTPIDGEVDDKQKQKWCVIM